MKTFFIIIFLFAVCGFVVAYLIIGETINLIGLGFCTIMTIVLCLHEYFTNRLK